MPSGVGIGDRFPRHSYARTGRRSEDARTAMDKAADARTKLARLLATKALPMKSRSRISRPKRKPSRHWPEHGANQGREAGLHQNGDPQWEEQARKNGLLSQ